MRLFWQSILRPEPTIDPTSLPEPSTESTLLSLTVGDLIRLTSSAVLRLALPAVTCVLMALLGAWICYAYLDGGNRPGPEPNPPGPTPGPENPFEGLAAEVCELAIACESPDRQGDARSMAGAIDGLVARIDAGELPTLDLINTASNEAVTAAVPPAHRRHWHPWSAEVSTMLRGYTARGILSTAPTAAQAFTEIARGLSMSAEQ